jgi:hypothetical protein
MPDRPRQVGVCIVRAQVQGDYLRITVTSNPNVTRTPTSTSQWMRLHSSFARSKTGWVRRGPDVAMRHPFQDSGIWIRW